MNLRLFQNVSVSLFFPVAMEMLTLPDQCNSESKCWIDGRPVCVVYSTVQFSSYSSGIISVKNKSINISSTLNIQTLATSLGGPLWELVRA